MIANACRGSAIDGRAARAHVLSAVRPSALGLDTAIGCAQQQCQVACAVTVPCGSIASGRVPPTSRQIFKAATRRLQPSADVSPSPSTRAVDSTQTAYDTLECCIPVFRACEAGLRRAAVCRQAAGRNRPKAVVGKVTSTGRAATPTDRQIGLESTVVLLLAACPKRSGDAYYGRHAFVHAWILPRRCSWTAQSSRICENRSLFQVSE